VDGTKFGKTESGTIWLDGERTSPWEFWQFLFNTEDAKVGEYLRMFTWLDEEEITALDRATAADAGKRAAQRVLANSVTALVHGDAVAKAVEKAAAVLFSGRVVELDAETLSMAVAGAPSAVLPPEGISVVDGLLALGFVDSRGKARSLVEQGGVHVNGGKELDGDRVLTGADAIAGRFVLLRKGKREQGVLVLS
jgi:tyrosyl-tRNA synthetase